MTGAIQNQQHEAPNLESFAVVHWVESTHTPSHLERFAEITRELARIGVSQVLMSGEDGLRMAIDRSGSLEEFGFPKEVTVVPLPTHRTDAASVESEIPHDSAFALWQYMNDPSVVSERQGVIEKTLGAIQDRGLRVSHVIPEMYPVGMCILGSEVEFLHHTTKALFPDAKVTPLARDIPAMIPGSRFNDPYDQLERMRRYADSLFVRGDEGVLEQYYEQYGMDDAIRSKLRVVGHFIGRSIPAKNFGISDQERRVLVSAGGSSSGAAREENEYYKFFRQIIAAKPLTAVADHAWTVCVPEDFPTELRAEVSEAAELAGGVEIRPNMSIAEHRQAIVDSLLFVTVSGYSGMLAGIQSRVPTVVVPAQLQKSGVQRDVIDRSQRYHDEGLVTQIAIPQLDDLPKTAQLIDQRLLAGPAPESKIPHIDGARVLARYIQDDLRSRTLGN